ncbi:SdiA-regulated domain-containing protein [Chitinophagaceae bacterium LB-8]|jgi:uncharacterized protein YjiK|uniref:SdiA-regulated domain-containing protein n=1 Tax=Paraflavisolibacter caeni TaxID=2982496 RepID=A0A9X2XZE7_9BACT|nr:SdiA-regulated domain-containing protein [Paraflavisolibacter caeni]MCU7551697.1 SdiA-regulated domain-containing protein [Paraflavisolibacter caeni]
MMSKIFQTQCPALVLVSLFGLLTLITSCKEKGIGSPRGYNLDKPVRRELGKVLNEISGLSYNTDDNTLLAISDSRTKIFAINLQTQKLSDYAKKFFEQKDFEDLVKLDSFVYVLISNGTILEVPLKVNDSEHTNAYSFWLTGKNDFETLYYDSAAKGLIMICKSCADEKGKEERTAYRFDLTGKKFDSTAFYTISSKDVKALLKDDEVEFKPSAAAINPKDKRLYILSSAGQLLVITDTKGNVLEAYRLHPDQHPQAEGITFSPKGTMFISNEGKFGKATLQVYAYRVHTKQK